MKTSMEPMWDTPNFVQMDQPRLYMSDRSYDALRDVLKSKLITRIRSIKQAG